MVTSEPSINYFEVNSFFSYDKEVKGDYFLY